jgi:membrane-associated protease RseP (regulator of RpoE activity)
VPLLPLDGGHLAIATYERIRSRKRRYQADVAKMLPFTAAVIVILVMLGGVSIWLDIFRPLANPFQ